MNAFELKNHIIENNLIDKILESIGCHSLSHTSRDIRCAFPDKNNATAISIKDNLSVRSYSSGREFMGDIYTLVMQITDKTFPQSLRRVHEILGIKYSYRGKIKQSKNTIDPLSFFTKHVKRSREEREVTLSHDEIIAPYINKPRIEFIREGILKKTHDVFSISYDPYNHRIIIPHRYWSGDRDDFLGLNKRTIIPNFEELGIPKYKLDFNMPKEMNLYGLNENYKSIQERETAVVFEAEKSVLKRHSMSDETGVALSGHEMSKEQIKILLSLNVEIVIALDKDIELFKTLEMCEPFYKHRKVSYIVDTEDILGKKDSPADAKDYQYRKMFRDRKEYRLVDHNKYIKDRERRYGKKD